MTSRLVSVPNIGSSTSISIRGDSLQYRDRCPSFRSSAFSLKITNSKKTIFGLKSSRLSFAWKSSPGPSAFGRILVLPPNSHLSFAAKASGFAEEGGHAGSYSIPIIFKFILDIFEAIIKLSRTLWALYTKEKSLLTEIEEDVEKATEMVQDTAKIVANAAESVENVSRVISEDAKKVDAFLEKMKDSPGNMEQTAEFVRETAKIVEDVAERVEKLSHEVEQDAKKVDALAEKVEETTEIIFDEIEEVFGPLGTPAEKTSKPRTEGATKDATNEEKREREVTAASSTDKNRDLSSTASSRMVADWNWWNPLRSFVRTLGEGDYSDAAAEMGRIVTRAFLMATILFVIDAVTWGGALGAQRHLLLIRKTLTAS